MINGDVVSVNEIGFVIGKFLKFVSDELCCDKVIVVCDYLFWYNF